MLGPVLFVLYTVELISLIERHGLSPHLYADDMQVYGSCPPAAVDALSSQVTECADDIKYSISVRSTIFDDNCDLDEIKLAAA